MVLQGKHDEATVTVSEPRAFSSTATEGPTSECMGCTGNASDGHHEPIMIQVVLLLLPCVRVHLLSLTPPPRIPPPLCSSNTPPLAIVLQL
eukprot:3458992-Rhodomonas_salina.1